MKYSRVINFIELESRMVVARTLGEREWKLFLSGYIPSIWDDEKVLNMDGGERLLIVGEQSYRCARGEARMSNMVLDHRRRY